MQFLDKLRPILIQNYYSSENIQKDELRDMYLSGLGFTVLRFSDRDIFKDIDGVLQEIFDHL